MPLGMQLKIIPINHAIRTYDEFEEEANDFMKGKNVLATSVKDNLVWIWWKEGPPKETDHEFTAE
jgi:hypothetical protein